MQTRRGRLGPVGLLRRIHVWVLVTEKIIRNLRVPMLQTEIYKDVDTDALLALYLPMVRDLSVYETGNRYISQIFTVNSNINAYINQYAKQLPDTGHYTETVLFFADKVLNNILLNMRIITKQAFFKTEHDHFINRINHIWEKAEVLDEQITTRFTQCVGIQEDSKEMAEQFYTVVDACYDAIVARMDTDNLNITDTGVVSQYFAMPTEEDIMRFLYERLHLDMRRIDTSYPLTTQGYIVTA